MSKRLEFYNHLWNAGMAEGLLEDLRTQRDSIAERLTTVNPTDAEAVAGYQYAHNAFKHLIEFIEDAPLGFEAWQRRRIDEEREQIRKQQAPKIRFTPDKKEDPCLTK